MSAMTADNGATLRYEIRLSLRSQSELDPIEAWLKLNAKAPWKMEFQGMSKPAVGGGAAQRVLVMFRFADQADAARFQGERTRTPVAPKPTPTPKDASTVAKVSRSISEIFSPAKKAAPSRTSPRPAVPSPGLDRGDPEDFLKCASDLVRNVDQVMVSKVQLIGLDRVKEHFGDAWSRVAARADQVAERVIQKRLTQQDMMTKVHDLNYLILF
ncbi:MAG: hypothetical protein HYR63_03570, partial [Proteobacteria bacterium]|nr:hypothetical protein [Pseudomonadota bacterium]MBI3498539.1 hypothetical protein [Pseudomonadota bacterium]